MGARTTAKHRRPGKKGCDSDLDSQPKRVLKKKLSRTSHIKIQKSVNRKT